ncbi:hypothetical protein N9043_01975 [bacterium]|nr:hypothetical protein [bacterium]
MSHTHYFQLLSKPSNNQINKFLKGVRSIINSSNVLIVDGFGEADTTPSITKDYISFNGCGDDSCESMYIDFTDLSWSFCKTNRMPYDGVVVKVLELAQETMNFKWSATH